jgi:N-(2-amino-2-carboxyethyl)-L-glutamate synthase
MATTIEARAITVATIPDYGILSAIGQTPLVRLVRMYKDASFRLYAKMESANPGGSLKDRPARHILRQAIERGVIHTGATVIESSSGNMGLGLAQACLYYGIRFICVVDAKTTTQNIRLLRAYGAEVDVVTEPGPDGEYLSARLARVHVLLDQVKGSFWPNQYANVENARAQQQTMGEIAAQLDGHLDYLFCATSTCGTLRGCKEYVRMHSLKTRVVAVDAVGSVIFGTPKRKRLIPGHGAAVVPGLFQEGLADEVVQVDDKDCVIGCRRLARREAILAGGSSGAAMMAVERLSDRIREGATCVVICADRGERYLDTIYSDEWVTAHFGDLSPSWND